MERISGKPNRYLATAYLRFVNLCRPTSANQRAFAL